VASNVAQLHLVLASGSPRRQELLQEAGYDFEIVRSEMEERLDPQLSLGEITIWNAMRKGISVARAHPSAVVLAADTLVSLGGEIIGKPVDMADALAILRRLSGRTHQVCTGVFVGRRADSVFSVFREVSHVTFKTLNEQGLRDYLESVNPLDKAGAYGAQEKGAQIIAKIDGPRSNVVGLPMAQTTAVLRNFGVVPRVR
jgi:septum formation protein